MVRIRLLRDIGNIFDGAGPAQSAEPIDEYRELAILAHAWERDTLKPRAAPGAVGRAEDGEGAAPDR